MRLPVFLRNRMVSFLHLPLTFLLVVLFVNIGDDLELFVIVGEEYFCLFDGKSHLTFLEVEIGEFLVAYHVVYVTH